MVQLRRRKMTLKDFETQKTDTPYFASLKITQLLYQTMFRWTYNLKVISCASYANHPRK